MFPIRDHNPSRPHRPMSPTLLMAVNIAVFLSYVGLFSDAARSQSSFSTGRSSPAAVHHGGGYNRHLHLNVSCTALGMHLAVNMLFLYIISVTT